MPMSFPNYSDTSSSHVSNLPETQSCHNSPDLRSTLAIESYFFRIVLISKAAI